MADADTGGVEPVKIYENTFRLEPTEEQRSGDPRYARRPIRGRCRLIGAASNI